MSHVKLTAMKMSTYCDAAGIRLPGQRWIDLPAPPPEFNLEAWRESLTRLRAAGLRTLYRTHFGDVSASGETADDALSDFERVLEYGASAIRDMVEQDLARDEMVERFTGSMRDKAVADGLGESELRAYELANPRVMSVDGMARYWRRRKPSA